jgi:hypothetical protein
MALNRLYGPFRPDLNNFLFAAVGEERNGIPLSMISALAQLDLDPWDEARRLSTLAKHEAVERLTELILRLPGLRRPSAEARQIAVGLVDVLPTHNGAAEPAEEPRRGRSQNTAPGKAFWLICLALAAAAFLLMLISGGNFPFSERQPSSTLGTTENLK